MNISTAAKAVIAVVVVVVVLMKVGTADIAGAISRTNLFFLGAVYMILAIIILLNTLNLRVMFSPLAKLPYTPLLRKYAFSWSLGFITPGKLGEFSLAHFLDIPTGKASAVIAIEKMVTVSVLIAFSAAGAVLFFKGASVAPIIVFAAALFVFVFIIASSHGRDFLRRILGHHATGFSETLILYRRKKKGLIISNAVFAGIRWTLFAVMSFLLFFGVGESVSFFALIAIVSLSSLAAMIPISISGLGIREGVFVFLCTQVGISATSAAAVAVLSLTVSYTTVFALFAAMLGKTNFKSVSVSQRPKGVGSP